MFNNEEELKNSIPNTMNISIIYPNPKKNDLSQKVLEKIGLDFKERLKFSCVTAVKDIYKDLEIISFQKEKVQPSNGLINKKWMDDLFTKRPALIIYYYKIPNGANKAAEEKKIYESISEIRNYDELVYIFLFIICKDTKENPYNFNSDDTQKAYNLRNIIQKELIFEFPTDEIWKYIDLGNFANNVLHYTRLYFRKYKSKIKEKKVKANSREEKIECDVMLGVLSIVKTKKIYYTKSKYLEEAYDLISDPNYNKNKYLYGNKSINPKFNLLEVRAVADWLFFKIIKMITLKLPSSINQTSQSAKNIPRSLTSNIIGTKQQGNANKPSEFESLIDKYQNHIKTFLYSPEFLKNEKNDKCVYYEYFWLVQRYQNLSELYEENIKNSNKSKKKNLALAMLYLKQIYYIIKLIKFFNKNQGDNLNSIIVKNKEVPINKVETSVTRFYGRAPSYSYKDVHNPLLKFELGFDENIFFKKFIFDKKLNEIDTLNDLVNQYISRTLSIFKNINSSLISKNNFVGGIDLYLNTLKIILSSMDKACNGLNNPEIKMDENLLKIVNSFPNINLNNIKKFPKIFLHYLELVISSLIYQMNNPDITMTNYSKTKLLINLSLLGSLRKLNDEEENIFFKLLNDEQFVPVEAEGDNENTNGGNDIIESKPVVINLMKEKKNENSIFNFDYTLKNGEDSQEKKILDLVEYNFSIKTYLFKENLKLNSVKVYLQCVNEDTIDKQQKKEIIIKEYNKEELNDLELNANTPINLEHKIFMKYKKGKIYLRQVDFTLCKKENIIYRMELPNDLNKMIFITNLNKKVLNIKVKKEKFTIGINQLNKFEVEVSKEEGYNDVKVNNFKMNFVAIPSYYKKTVPNTSMKALLNTKAPSSSIKNQNISSTLSQQIFGINPKTKQESGKNMPSQERQSAKISTVLKNQGAANHSSMQNFFYKTPSDKQNPAGNNANKTQMFPPSTTSANSTNTPTPGTGFPSEKIQVALPSPEFYFINENNSLDKTEKTYEKEFNDFEELLKKNVNKFGVLIKFLQAGQYEIKLNINYSIRHIDIEDYFEFNQEETLKFIVIDPFKFNNEINSNNFITISKIKEDKTESKVTEFLTNKNIQMNLILTNQLNEEIIIKDIILQLDEEKLTEKNKDISVKSPIKDIIISESLPVEIKNQILKIVKSAEYNIPFEVKFNDKFQGSLGKIILKWTTPSLIEYRDNEFNLVNENSFDFPYISVSPTELDYEYDTAIQENKDVLFNIKVKNISEKCRKILFMIENGEDINFIVSGLTKQIYSIEAKDIINVVFRLIPLVHNVELKLPKIKICEMSYNSQEKICSNYYYPEKISIL